MDITINNITVTLQKKDRTIGSEAPAIRVKMLNGETKVIGMMADSVQVMISLPFPNSLSDQLETIISKHNKSSNIYIISSKKLQKNTDTSFSSTEFKDYALKMGVYATDELCAKSIFIINKEGEIVYKEILEDLESEFNLKVFDKKLTEAIKFKKKGHTHENWMGV